MMKKEFVGANYYLGNVDSSSESKSANTRPTPIILGFGAAMAGLAGLESEIPDIVEPQKDSSTVDTNADSHCGEDNNT